MVKNENYAHLSLIHINSNTLIFILLSFLSTNHLFAQDDYVPIPTENAVWIQQSTITGPTTNQSTVSLGIGGDTTINNILYYKIYESKDSIWSMDNTDIIYRGSFREEEKSVYFIPYWYESGEEEKIMDFNVEIGDTTSYSEIIKVSEEYYTAYVSQIDSVQLLNGEKRKRIIIDYSERIITTFDTVIDTSLYIIENYDVWIEGIGRVPWYAGNGTLSAYDLLCFYKDDIQLYDNETVDYCFISTSTSLIEEVESNIEIYPNPTSNYLNIYYKQNILSNNAHFQIVNMNGQVVDTFQHVQAQTTYVVSVDHLPIGNYILQYMEKGVLQYSKQFAVHR